MQTFYKLLRVLAISLYKQGRREEERSAEHWHEARYVERVLEAQVLYEQIMAAVRRHYQITRLSDNTATVCQQPANWVLSEYDMIR